MVNNHQSHQTTLKGIAHREMLRRGFLPDFSAGILAELDKIQAPAKAHEGSVRDLRGLLWCSIDNDDSLDLDQLTAAESLSGGQTKILVAIADVDSLVLKRIRKLTATLCITPHQFTQRPRSFPCCPKNCPPILPRSILTKTAWLLLLR